MNLNVRGISKLWNAFYVGIEFSPNQIKCIDDRLCKIDFEEKDFRDSVILSVEEAKAIAFDLKFLKSFVQFCPSEVKERIAQFESRIEQSEGGKNDNAS